MTHELGYRVRTNTYLTPAGGQGLTYHYDPYLTLIDQLHGRKAWPMHAACIDSPPADNSIRAGQAACEYS